MPILKIRENFTTKMHSLTSIQNFELKWKDVLQKLLEQRQTLTLTCPKISKEVSCFEFRRTENEIHLDTSYLIGLDYLAEGVPLMIEPKFQDHNRDFSIDFYQILFQSLPYVKSTEDISDLYFVDFSKPTIRIQQQDDFLTPVLVIQFITYLDRICKAGLQKGYYWVEDNLENKLKGKILVKDTLRKNHLKENYTRTVCKFQEYGINTYDNQFLKYVFQFCLQYLNQFQKLQIVNSSLEAKVNAIKSCLLPVTLLSTVRKEIQVKKNPLFPLYEKIAHLGNLILKRASFNITTTTAQEVETYPYWINMSKLFEIHVLRLLRQSYPQGVYFQRQYAGRIPDLVLDLPTYKAIIDVKYKPYEERSVEIEDVRQVAAYSKMKSIYADLKLDRSQSLDAIIIYPKVNSKHTVINDEILNQKQELRDYYSIYTLDVQLPILRKL